MLAADPIFLDFDFRAAGPGRSPIQVRRDGGVSAKRRRAAMIESRASLLRRSACRLDPEAKH